MAAAELPVTRQKRGRAGQRQRVSRVIFHGLKEVNPKKYGAACLAD
jgi:hypothetical protein